MPDKHKGLFLALTAAIISGISIFINKFAVASFENPVMLPTIKNSLVGIILLLTLLLSGRFKNTRDEVLSLNKKKLISLVSIAVIGGSLPFYLFFTGLSQIPSVNASIIHKTLVFWVVLLAFLFLKEKITKTQGFAVLLLFAGNLMIGGFNGFTYSIGELMVLLATFFWSLETVLVKKLLKFIRPDTIATIRMGLGSLVLILISLITAPADIFKTETLSPSQWFWLMLTAVTLFAYVSIWYRALKIAPAVTVSTVLVLATLVTNVLSAVFINHSLNPILTGQNILLISGFFILLIGRNPESCASSNQDSHLPSQSES